jgi:hypothetical protein
MFDVIPSTPLPEPIYPHQDLQYQPTFLPNFETNPFFDPYSYYHELDYIPPSEDPTDRFVVLRDAFNKDIEDLQGENRIAKKNLQNCQKNEEKLLLKLKSLQEYFITETSTKQELYQKVMGRLNRLYENPIKIYFLSIRWLLKAINNANDINPISTKDLTCLHGLPFDGMEPDILYDDPFELDRNIDLYNEEEIKKNDANFHQKNNNKNEKLFEKKKNVENNNGDGDDDDDDDDDTSSRYHDVIGVSQQSYRIQNTDPGLGVGATTSLFESLAKTQPLSILQRPKIRSFFYWDRFSKIISHNLYKNFEKILKKY